MTDITRGGQGLAKYIDHTLLKPTSTYADFEQLCKEAVDNSFFSVCVPPVMVFACSNILKNTPVAVCTVIGFPFGNTLTETKEQEAARAIEYGADELDMVINVSALKSNDTEYVLEDIQRVVGASSGRPVKVIIESCYLTEQEKIIACDLIFRGGAKFVKTSTGFGSGGATESDIVLLKNTVGNRLEIKASGGIRDTKTAQRMIELGATRLGTSNGVAIIGRETTSSQESY